MAERYGGDMIDEALRVTAITSIVGTSLYEGGKIPDTDTSEDTINYYRSGPYSGRLEYFESRWSVDCRRKTEKNSRDLATIAFGLLNRLNFTVDGKQYFAVCDILTTIPPINTTDVYNSPVSVYLRRK